MSAAKSPFLELPAELRLQIYAHALAPTRTLFLTSTPVRRFVTEPSLPLALLRTCRQIYAETTGLLTCANEVGVTVDAHDTCWPVLAESRLPQGVLERLEHAFVLLDCTQRFHATYADVDFASFGALTALRTLRLAVVYDAAHAADPPARLCHSWVDRGADLRDLLAEILARIPRRTRVLCAVREGSPQAECVRQVLENRRRAKGVNSGDLHVLSVEDLGAAVEAVPDEVRGSQSGGNEDVFAEYHTEEYGGKPPMWKAAGINLGFA